MSDGVTKKLLFIDVGRSWGKFVANLNGFENWGYGQSPEEAIGDIFLSQFPSSTRNNPYQWDKIRRMKERLGQEFTKNPGVSVTRYY